MNEKICFFISPIGEADSPERIQSDILTNDILRFCCEPFKLELIRADQLTGTNDINSDIINLLHSAELCIADLTGLNANVMFELGIRIETGLPIIIIAKEGTQLPFDIRTTRTIFFGNLDERRKGTELINNIRRYIEVYEAEDYNPQNTHTINDVYGLLEKIYSSLAYTPSTTRTEDLNYINDDTDVEELLESLDPSEAFKFAYRTNRIDIAEKLLDYMKSQPRKYYLNKLCALATQGSLKAMSEIEQVLSNQTENDNFDEVIELLGSLVTCYMRRDITEQKEAYMESIFDKVMSLATKNIQKAAVLNQKQRMAAGQEKYEYASELAKEIISLYDEEPAYYYNYAMVLNELGDTEGAKIQIKNCNACASNDEPHEEGLMLACKLFKHAENEDDQKYFAECYTKLKQINPLKAKLINFDL